MKACCIGCSCLFRISPSRAGIRVSCSAKCYFDTVRKPVPPKKYLRKTVNGKRDYVHRHVMAELLGRPLGYDETVDHINRDKQDNRPENLRLLSRKEHGALSKTYLVQARG